MRATATRTPAPQAAGRSPAQEPHSTPKQTGLESLRQEAVAQRQLADFIRTSPRAVAQAKREAVLRGETVQCAGPQEDEMVQGKLAPAQLAGGGPKEDELLQGKLETAQRAGPEEEETLQGKFAPAQLAEGEPEEDLLQGKLAPAQREEASSDHAPRENKTGLPDDLKSGVESLSGISMDHVKVHYNSAQPAQLNALAYAQGSDIHVAPGQEEHLPHEAWHVVQQAQGRVKPTMQMKGGVPVNDDAGLEREADVMGGKALASAAQLAGGPEEELLQGKSGPVQCTAPAPAPRLGAPCGDSAIQRLVAYAEEDNNTHNDYAVMKMLHQVSQHRDGHPVVPLNSQTDFSGMKAGETLFLAGHGKRETGNMRMSGTTTDLIGWLNHNKRGIPNNIGAITILSCYSGEVIGNTTLADKIAAGLNHKGISVSGGKGFSFGTPSLSETGKSSVLALSNENLYWLGLPNTMGWQWAEMKPTSTEGALKEKYSDMNIDVSLTIAQNVAAQLGFPIVAGEGVSSETAKQNKTTVIGVLDGMMGTFRKEATRIQTRLDFIIQRLPGNSVEAKLEVLRHPGSAGKDQKHAQAWPKLIADQYALFKKYYVFTPGNSAFHTATS